MITPPRTDYEVLFWVFLSDLGGITFGSWSEIEKHAEELCPGAEWIEHNGHLRTEYLGNDYRIDPSPETRIIINNLQTLANLQTRTTYYTDTYESVLKSFGLKKNVNTFVLIDLLKLDPFRRAVKIAQLKEEGL